MKLNDRRVLAAHDERTKPTGKLTHHQRYKLAKQRANYSKFLRNATTGVSYDNPY